MYMLKYALKRIGLMLLTFFVIVTMCFYFIKLLPLPSVEQQDKDAELIMARREMLGYDKPWEEQYWIFLFGRTAYTYEVLDANGNKTQSKDSNGNLLWQTTPLLDENGDIVYKKDADGDYVDQDGNKTFSEINYVPMTEYVLDANGEKIPVYATKTVYELSKLPDYVGKNYTKKNVGGIIRGYFGTGESVFRGRDVWGVFVEKVPYTVALNLYSILFAIPIGLALGIFAALKKNKWQDYVISTGVMIFVSVPSFVYAFLVQYVLYFKLGWTPAGAVVSDGPWSWTFFASIVGAILSMSFGTIAGFARYTRAELTEVLTNEYMLLARTKGLTRAQAVLRHALRNAMVVLFPMILGEFISIMSGSLIIEKFFAIPGVGGLYLSAINVGGQADYNFFMLLTMFYTFIGLAAGIVVDISYGIIDPRIRMGAK